MQSYYAKQNDNNTRVLEITLTKDGQPLTISKSEKATVRYTRSDGKGDEANAAIEGNEVIVRLTNEMLALSGTTYLDVALHNGTDVLSSSTLSIITGGNPLAAEKITGSSDFLILIETLDRADKSVKDVEALLPKATQAIKGANAAKTSAEKAASTANAAAKRAEDAAQTMVIVDTTLSKAGEAADAKTVGERIKKSEQKFEYAGIGINKFNKQTATDGGVIYQGLPYLTIIPSETGCYSDFIPVNGDTAYCRNKKSFEPTGTEVAYQFTFFYDGNKQSISHIRHYTDSPFKTPVNCKYIRMNLPIACKDLAMLCEGTSCPEAYEPYRELHKLAKEIRVPIESVENKEKIWETIPKGVISSESLSTEVKENVDGVDNKIRVATSNYSISGSRANLEENVVICDHVRSGRIRFTKPLSADVLIHGANYFNYEDLVEGRIDRSGNRLPSVKHTEFYTHNFVPINSNHKMYWNRDKDTAHSYLYFHFYDINKMWISRLLIGDNTLAGKFVTPENAAFLVVACENITSDLKIPKEEKLCVADIDVGDTKVKGYDGNAPAEQAGGYYTYYGHNVFLPYMGYEIVNGKIKGASSLCTVGDIMVVSYREPNQRIAVEIPVEGFDKAKLSNVILKYGRYAGTDYVIARIFKNTIQDSIIKPHALAFDNGGEKISTYSQKQDFLIAINAGLFDMTDHSYLGTTIVDKTVVSDHKISTVSGMADTLVIKNDGTISSVPYETTTQTMLESGVTQAIQGWGAIISDFKKTDLEALKEILYPADGTFGKDYIVTAKHPRTAIGQFKNGDYMVFSCGGREQNQAGMTCAEMQEIFVNEGLKFVYNLDGGGSCNMMFYKKELAMFTENRKDPTYIIFN